MHCTTQQQFVCSTPLTRHSFSISSFSHDSPLSLLFHWPPLTLPSPSITSEHSQATHKCTHHCSMEPNTIRAFLCQRQNEKKKNVLMFLFQKNHVEVCGKTCQNRRTLQTLFIWWYHSAEGRAGRGPRTLTLPFSNICKRDISLTRGREREGSWRGQAEAAGGSLSSFRSQGGIRSWPGEMSWAAQLSRKAPVPGLTLSQVCK